MSQVFLGVSIFLVNEDTDFVVLRLCTYDVKSERRLFARFDLTRLS
jgi:hypothetical protein